MLALMASTAKQGGKNQVTCNFKRTVEAIAADGSYVEVDVTGCNKRTPQHLGLQQFGILQPQPG